MNKKEVFRVRMEISTAKNLERDSRAQSKRPMCTWGRERCGKGIRESMGMQMSAAFQAVDDQHCMTDDTILVDSRKCWPGGLMDLGIDPPTKPVVVNTLPEYNAGAS